MLRQDAMVIYTEIKSIIFVYGVLAIAMAFAAQVMGGHVMQASTAFSGSVRGPLFAMFVVGAFFPWTNGLSAVIGAFAGLAFGMVLAIGGAVAKYHRSSLPTNVTMCAFKGNTTAAPIVTDPPPHTVFPLFRLSFMTYGLFATLLTIVIGVFLSLCTGVEKPSEQDPSLIVPAADKFCCCFPRKCREKCYCGVNFADKESPAEMDKRAEAANGEISREDPMHTINTGSEMGPPPSYSSVTTKNKDGMDNKAYESTSL